MPPSLHPADRIIARRTVMEMIDGGIALYRLFFSPIFLGLLALFVPYYGLKAALFYFDWIPMDQVMTSFHVFDTRSYTAQNLLLLWMDANVHWIGIAGVTVYVDRVARLGTTTRGDVVRHVRSVVAPLLRLNLIFVAIVLAGLVMGLVGGIILHLVFLMTTPVIVLERKRELSAVWSRSQHLMKNEWGRGAGMSVLSWVLLGILGVSLTYLLTGFYSLVLEQISWISGILPDVDMIDLSSRWIVSVILLPMETIFIVLFYYDVRATKEGLDLEVLTESLRMAS